MRRKWGQNKEQKQKVDSDGWSKLDELKYLEETRKPIFSHAKAFWWAHNKGNLHNCFQCCIWSQAIIVYLCPEIQTRINISWGFVFTRSKEEPHLPMEISQDLKEKLSTFDKKNISLEKILKKFKGKGKLMSSLNVSLSLIFLSLSSEASAKRQTTQYLSSLLYNSCIITESSGTCFKNKIK